jgi:hypothetical protein
MTRRCACRGYLEADPCDPAEVGAAVASHRLKPQHQDWWFRQQVVDEKVHIPVRLGPTATLRRLA